MKQPNKTSQAVDYFLASEPWDALSTHDLKCIYDKFRKNEALLAEVRRLCRVMEKIECPTPAHWHSIGAMLDLELAYDPKSQGFRKHELKLEEISIMKDGTFDPLYKVGFHPQS